VILNTVRDRGPLSRLQISDSCSLSVATAKRLVDELISVGMLREGNQLKSSGRGRKPSVIGLSRRYGYTVGVVIEPGRLSTTVLGFDGSTIYQKETSPSTDARGPLQELLIAETAEAIAACSAEENGPLLGIGIGVAGLVDARSGVVVYCPGLPGWENVRLAALMAERFGVDVLLDDAVRCMALAEKRHGAVKNVDTFLFLYIGLGVGSGIILDNRIYRGRNGVSGEFGHITVKENGPLCKCGNRGCLEALVSTNAILARVRELSAAGVYTTLAPLAGPGRSLTLSQVCRAAMEGDKLANIVVAEIEESVGIGVADLINIFDPGTVILAGEVMEELHGLILEGIERIVRRRAMHAIAQRTAIMKSVFESDSGALGAATLVIERLLGNEILNL
jgi:predicted NBD/HSP70 family sugar kinase